MKYLSNMKKRGEMSIITDNNLSLLGTRSGNLTLRVTCEDGSIKTLHSLYDPEAEAKSIVDAFSFDGKGILIILGLGLGYHLTELAERFPEAAIIVVEGSPDIYELARKHGKVGEGEGQGEWEDRVRFIVGLSSDDALKEISRLQTKAGIPPLTVFPLASEISAFPCYYNPILTTLKNTVSVRLWERLRYPKFKEETAKVTLIDFGYFLNREVEKAIRRLGHKVEKVPVKKGEDGEVIVSRLIKSILDLKPDFFLTINHLGFDQEGVLTSFFKSIEMPVASWYVDSPEIIVKAFDKNVSPYTSVFVWDKGYLNNVKSMGFDEVLYLPLATDEEVFRPIKKQKRVKGYECDVGFVGSSMVEPTDRWMSMVKEGQHPMIDRLAEKLHTSRRPFETILTREDKDMVGCLEAKERMDIEAAVIWKATLLYRLSCIRRLKGFDVRVRGDDGWKSLLNGDYRLGAPLHYYRELPLFYNACKINFNATSLQMMEAVNQRVFDVPACGGFILTDHQAAIEELFDVGKEVITFKDKDEIPGFAKYYLSNPAARETIAGKGRERVLKEHTYKNRIERIIRVMRERYEKG